MWQALASIETLQQRALILRIIRDFFEQRGVLEVDVPVLGEFGVSDPHIDALTVHHESKLFYLQTSPEYFMKRLLASGSGDIYSLGKAFRKDEQSRIHHREFTMLEWYRLGMNDQELIDEVGDLVCALQPGLELQKISYEQLYFEVLGINPHSASASELEQVAKSQLDVHWQDEAKSTWLDLLFTHIIEPQLGEGLFAVYDYPACQSALAKLGTDKRGMKVAKRFEFYLHGVELANGYWESTDGEELKKRFIQDNRLRAQLDKPEIPIDEKFLAALQHGLPSCAGVALGVDRLVMALLGLKSISEQRCF